MPLALPMDCTDEEAPQQGPSPQRCLVRGPTARSAATLVKQARQRMREATQAPPVAATFVDSSSPSRGRALASDSLALPRTTHVSAHFRLLVPVSFTRGGEFLDLAEALFPLLEQHFNVRVAPADLPLEIRFFETQEQYRDACRVDGLPEAMYASSGGGYWTGTRASCFFKQPSDVFDRHLFIHELVHHVHFTACMNQMYLGEFDKSNPTERVC